MEKKSTHMIHRVFMLVAALFMHVATKEAEDRNSGYYGDGPDDYDPFA